MKVAHLLRKYNPTEWGGTETALHRLCDGLLPIGVRSVAFAPRIPENKGIDPLTEAGCVVKRFNACVPFWGLPPEAVRQMTAVGGNLMSFGLIRSLWREPALDVIHSHTLGRIGGIGRMVARRRSLPFLVTTHGGVYDLPIPVRQNLCAPVGQGWEWGKFCGFLLKTRRLLSEADAIVTCNEREAALIRERHPGRRVTVQPHGVSIERYRVDHRAAARSAFPLIPGREVLLAVGRIDGVKNQSWLVEQMAALAGKYPRLLLVMAGAVTDQGYGDALARRVAHLGLEGRVLMAGALPPGDPRLIGLMQEAKAIVLPSVSETFGLVILEAWAAGTPVLSSRTSGAKGLIAHGASGLLFDLERPEEFHAAVDELWSSRGTADRLVAAGSRRVIADFNNQVLAQRMHRLYETLIEEKHALRPTA